MRKQNHNPFELTVYYSGNLCIVDEKHSYRTGEILLTLLDYDTTELRDLYSDLKKFIRLLLFKDDLDYNAWEQYDENVYRAQKILNRIKDLLFEFPIYRHFVRAEQLDYSDLIHVLSRHTELFDDRFNRTIYEAEQKSHKERLRASGLPEDVIDSLFDPERDTEDDFDNEELDRTTLERYYDRLQGTGYLYYEGKSTSRFEDDLTHFRPYWDEQDTTIDRANSMELLNVDLRKLFDPYLIFMETILFAKDTYGRFLDEHIHVKGRFLTDDEIAIAYDAYTKIPTFKKLAPQGTMKLECTTIRRDDKLLWCDNYTFDNLAGFVYYDFFRGLRSGYVPKRCEHCGKYFLLTSGRYYDFCDNPVRSAKGKSCRDIGAHKKYEEKCKSDPIWLAYNRAYKAHYARLLKNKMTKSEFLTWSTWAVEYRDAALRKEVDIEEYEKKIRE
jgi:hypothetical protein